MIMQIASVKLIGIFLGLFIVITTVILANGTQPNIVFILADDLGYYDVGYHGRSVLTPNIDNLTAEGVRLEQYYTQPICTPSRASFMTGRYPIHIGFQYQGSINVKRALGLSLNFTLLPEKLKELGYTTHALGKWHLGYYNPKYVPTSRGFDTFFGFYGADLHYFTHTSYDVEPQPPPSWCLDLHNNSQCVGNLNGSYTLNLYTQEAQRLIEAQDPDVPMFLYLAMQNVHNPIEVPEEFEQLYYRVRSIDRRRTLGMITAMDDSIGRIVETLRQKGEDFWSNTVIVFASDNGGWPIPDGHGSNYPLRGSKLTYFEGGIHVPAFVYSPLIKNPKRIENSLFHVSDWYPTILGLAGGMLTASEYDSIDGFDQWELISEGVSENVYPPRYEILHNLQAFNGRYTNAAIRLGNWKLITGRWANCTIYSYPFYCFWVPPPEFNTAISVEVDDPIIEYSYSYTENFARISKYESTISYKQTNYDPVMLFNIEQDPYERHDVKEKYPNIVEILVDRLDSYMSSIVPADNGPWEANNWEKAAKEKGCFAPWNFDD